MSRVSDINDDDELKETKEQQEQVDVSEHGWRPAVNTIQSIQGLQDIEAESEWVDCGIRNIAVDQINTADMTHVNSPEDFNKVSYADMTEGYSKLDTVVRPEVEKGAGGDYFYELDQELGLSYNNGYQRVYDAFYGGDAIRLEKCEEEYQVINGAHRLFVAQKLGVRSVPAHVVERQHR